MLPSETLKPAKSMIASLGIGMQALSAVISTNTPGSPRASMTLVAASTIGFKMSASTSGASCECVPGWASSGGRQARTQGAAFAGGKGKPEDAAWRSSGASQPCAYLQEVPLKVSPRAREACSAHHQPRVRDGPHPQQWPRALRAAERAELEHHS